MGLGEQLVTGLERVLFQVLVEAVDAARAAVEGCAVAFLERPDLQPFEVDVLAIARRFRTIRYHGPTPSARSPSLPPHHPAAGSLRSSSCAACWRSGTTPTGRTCRWAACARASLSR